MTRRLNVTFVSIIPTPYQRDLFDALASRGELSLRVLYIDGASPDNPWPPKQLRPYERILPGVFLPLLGRRVYVNWGLPDLSTSDYVVLSTFVSSWTGQRLMRGLKGVRWLYWGERFEQRLGWEAHAQRILTAPILRAAAVVGIGRRAELDFATRFPSAPHFSIPYCCSLSAFFELRRSSPCGRPLTFLFCGQMIHRKGIDLLLKAFDQLVSFGSRAELLLVGREADLGSFISAVSHDARRKIRYLGFQPPEQLARFFGEADVFVLPSRYDGWGVVINQALAAGMPIICSDQVGAGAELVVNGENGLVVPAGDPIRLQEAMEWFVKNPGAIQPFGSSSRSKARNLTPHRGAEEWMYVFESLDHMWPASAE